VGHINRPNSNRNEGIIKAENLIGLAHAPRTEYKKKYFPNGWNRVQKN